ncbi:MAG TPA: YbdK family carboxylate-amine ligase [Thermoleophilaceae bacterium]
MSVMESRFGGPAWARWNDGQERRYTVGAEEEAMLLRPPSLALAQASDAVLGQLSGGLAGHAAAETHAAVVELMTGVHGDIHGAVEELAGLRAELARELRPLGLTAASAGTYPLASHGENRVSGLARYRQVADSMRALARREPTLALHVHVGVPDAGDAVRVLNGLREAVPLLLALSANSPFSQGRDTGFASARTVIFQSFPRTGTARAFAGYRDYVRAVDALIGSGALPDPSFLWWDVRLQPKLGTVEVRVMDAQSNVADSAALIALVQSLVRLELEGDAPPAGDVGPEVLAENRFLAARDGSEARLIDPARRELVPLRRLVDELLTRCLPHAEALGCAGELEHARRLATANGADRQRFRAREPGGLRGLVGTMCERFSAERALGVPA